MSDRNDQAKYALASLFGPGREEMVSYTPHAQHLGMRVVEMGPRFAVVMLPYRAELIGDPTRGVVFGGAITTLLDHGSGIAVACAIETLRPIATIDLRVDYLRAAEPGKDLYARVECYRVTRNVAFVRGTAHDGNPAEPFASSVATMMLGANPTVSPYAKLLSSDESGKP